MIMLPGGHIEPHGTYCTQIGKELRICDRKMAFWARHPRYLPQTAQSEALRLKLAWAQSTGEKNA